MPCTPERVWRAITAAAAGGPGAEAGGRPLWSEPPAFFENLPVREPGTEDEDEAQI